ncbi:MAG: hypothetical protein KC431_04125 [Myxococcales bacterium]|nr:hypothetical protein [Myxococcales bacterium]
MTGEPTALEQLLREDPDDDLSWQVYGDALLARGDPRGELIALELGDYDGPEHQARIQALDKAQVDAIAPRTGTFEFEWRHGFVIAAVGRDLEFPRDVETFVELLTTPQLRLLSRLTLGFESWSQELGDPSESGLEWLADFGDRADTIPTLARADLRGLCSLSFAYSGAGEPLATVLAGLALPRLRDLDLRYCALGDAGAMALAQNPTLCALRVLRLQSNGIGPRGVEALAKAPALLALEELDLRGNPIGSDGAKALADAPQLATLERLYLDPLRRPEQRASIAAPLAASKHLRPGLARLWRARSATGGR